jgi:hypothetical protein
LKHTLVDLVFDADSKHIISFDTDRSLLIEICEIPVKNAKIMTQEKCAWVFLKWQMFSEFGKCMILQPTVRATRNDQKHSRSFFFAEKYKKSEWN